MFFAKTKKQRQQLFADFWSLCIDLNFDLFRLLFGQNGRVCLQRIKVESQQLSVLDRQPDSRFVYISKE